jgi:hypothetical protein
MRDVAEVDAARRRRRHDGSARCEDDPHREHDDECCLRDSRTLRTEDAPSIVRIG